MKRRALLQQCCAIGAFATAGCGYGTTDASGPADGTPTADGDGTPTETGDTDERSTTDWTVETVGSDCLSGEEPAATVAFPAGESVTFSGQLDASNPCHEVTIESADYDAGDDRLVVVLGTDGDDRGCTTCLGILQFQGRVDFDGGLPSAVEVRYGDGVLASVDRLSGSGAGGSGGVEGTSFAVLGRGAGRDTPKAAVEFDTAADRIVVRGAIEGSDGCKTAELSGVGYDAEADEVTIAVGTTDRPGTGDQLCSQQLIGISYEAGVTFADDVPRLVSVVHDGVGVVSAGR